MFTKLLSALILFVISALLLDTKTYIGVFTAMSGFYLIHYLFDHDNDFHHKDKKEDNQKPWGENNSL